LAALKLQKPRADEEIVIAPYDEKKAAWRELSCRSR
jgi:hypothetical protein